MRGLQPCAQLAGLGQREGRAASADSYRRCLQGPFSRC
jgi:hypothetical protein